LSRIGTKKLFSENFTTGLEWNINKKMHPENPYLTQQAMSCMPNMLPAAVGPCTGKSSKMKEEKIAIE